MNTKAIPNSRFYAIQPAPSWRLLTLEIQTEKSSMQT